MYLTRGKNCYIRFLVSSVIYFLVGFLINCRRLLDICNFVFRYEFYHFWKFDYFYILDRLNCYLTSTTTSKKYQLGVIIIANIASSIFVFNLQDLEKLSNNQ